MSFNGIFRNRYLFTLNKRFMHFNHGYASTLNPNTLSHQKLKEQTLYRPNLEKDACGVGMIANLNNDASRKLILNANEMLVNMSHRGACGLDEKCGDGAGILTKIPHAFFKKNIKGLPDVGSYGTGNVFFGKDLKLNSKIKTIIKKVVEKDFNFKLLSWRAVPTDNSDLGTVSLETEPIMEQIFIANNTTLDQDLFNRQLLLLRNVIVNRVEQQLNVKDYLYICSLSNKTITYKGQLTPAQLLPYFVDLQNDDFVSNFALVHSRFSTNTFPSWDRAQPNRISCHNGEINTLRGNKNWMHSRSGLAHSPYFGDSTRELFPICNDSMTDSGAFDSVLEVLSKGSEDTLPEVVISMIPEAWQNDAHMAATKRRMYEYLSCKIEPWDGPALIAFCDGNYAGAVLDRNGLRPSRYYVTSDDTIIFSSEVGVLPDLDQSSIIEKGRLEPGKIFLIDLQENRIILDEEFKHRVSSSKPYDAWLSEHLITLNDIDLIAPPPPPPPTISNDTELHTLNSKLNMFGFTSETIQLLLVPMMESGKEPLGSMGNDASLAILSSKPKLPYEYFKQLFAQVTNPPIDPIREAFVMSLQCPVGPELNIFSTRDKHCARLSLQSPVLSVAEMHKLKNVRHGEWKSISLDCTFKAYSGTQSMLDRIDELCVAAENAIRVNAIPMIVLSDSRANDKLCPLPSLIILGAIHQYLVSKQLRSKCALFVESGDCKEIHDYCTLLGYGADAICPYNVYSIISKLHYEEQINVDVFPFDAACDNYRCAVEKGILKVMSKMGISTLQSYKGAQIFEAIGFSRDVIDACFFGTESRVGGATFDVVYADLLRFHECGYGVESTHWHLRAAGDYHYRMEQEEHFNTPQTISRLQSAVRHNAQDAYNEYSELSNIQSSKVTLRGLLGFGAIPTPIPAEEVEGVESIMRRFATGAMSLGSISRETHETLAEAMNAIGGKSNTGEGGEDISRFGTSKRSAIKQIASGRFGVTINYLCASDQIQIKMAQGAKPGEGGELPGSKVSDYIGRIRHTTPGVQLISPPPHHDIYSIEDLSQLIFDLKQCNPRAQISVKLVSEIGVGIVAAGVTKAGANHITISGHDGGTGASAWTGIKNGGAPWELGIAEVQQTLLLNGLRDRVVIQTDGQLKTGRDVVIAALLGAEEYGFATAPLIALGCIMMRKCHLNTCPVGIATQDPELRKKFEGEAQHVMNYFYFVAQEVRAYMASLGFARIEQMVGRASDCLSLDESKLNYKSKYIDLSALLCKIDSSIAMHNTHSIPHDHNHLDEKLIALCGETLSDPSQPISIVYDAPLSNANRTVGATLSYEISRRYGEEGLAADNTICIAFEGYGGQSFATGLAKGVTLKLCGDSNDYVGKLLSGGCVAIYPPNRALETHTIVGNACLYGATSGKAFFAGTAGERFAVRNSGAQAVVEGVGDHGVEYMTGGCVVILTNKIGKNFAAGMSGGCAYIYDADRDETQKKINPQMINIEEVEDEEDEMQLKQLIEQHIHYTDSQQAKLICQDWNTNKRRFKKIMPNDYKRVLMEMKQKKQQEQ
eukprot:39763_1